MRERASFSGASGSTRIYVRCYGVFPPRLHHLLFLITAFYAPVQDSSTTKLLSVTKFISLINVLFVVANILVLHQLVTLESFKEQSEHRKAEFLAGGALKKKQKEPPYLFYGLEIAFIFPMAIYDNLDIFDDQKTQKLWKLVNKLETVGIPAIVGNRDTKSLSSWKLILERQGFEVASPLSPSYDQIERLITVIKRAGCGAHPELGAMHINIDARGRTLQETANVYKNTMAVEQAFDLIRSPRRMSAVSGKAKSLIAEFNSSIQRGYASIDASETYASQIALGIQQADSELFHRRKRYKVGLKIAQDEKTNSTTPQTFEFRGLEASLDPGVTVAWLKLATKFIAESYAGNVLPPIINRTADEAWSALFGQLIQDDALEAFFRKRRETMHVDPSDMDDINKHLCRQPGIKGKYLEALGCPENSTSVDDFFDYNFTSSPAPVPTQNLSRQDSSLTSSIENGTSTPS